MSPGRTPKSWLRGVDLNHRPLGYEPKRSILSPVESIALPRSRPANKRKSTPILHATCTLDNILFMGRLCLLPSSSGTSLQTNKKAGERVGRYYRAFFAGDFGRELLVERDFLTAKSPG